MAGKYDELIMAGLGKGFSSNDDDIDMTDNSLGQEDS